MYSAKHIYYHSGNNNCISNKVSNVWCCISVKNVEHTLFIGITSQQLKLHTCMAICDSEIQLYTPCVLNISLFQL